MTVSALDTVWKDAAPAAAGVHEYQRDAPPYAPAWSGSPSSRDAASFVAVSDPVAPLTVVAPAALSFAAAPAVGAQESVVGPPVVPLVTPTEKKMVSPALAPTRRTEGDSPSPRPSEASSTRVSSVTPPNAPRTASPFVPVAEKVYVPVAGAVQRYHSVPYTG